MFIAVQQNVQQSGFQLSQQWWWLILSLIITVIVGPIIVHRSKNRFDNEKKIEIVGNSISNINNRNGAPEPATSESPIYSNFLLNTLTVENKRSVTQSVTEIELYNIKKEDNNFLDIQYDGGFYDRNQKFVFLAYNNGTKEGQLNKYTVKFIRLGEEPRKAVYETEIIVEKPLIMKPGDIKSLIIYPFDEFVSEFEQNSRLYSLQVTVLDSKGNEIPNLTLVVKYDRSEKRFQNFSRGFAGQGIGEIPLINLIEDTTQKSVTCSQKLTAGANDVNFYILVDRSCSLKYDVAIKSGEKTIKGKEKYSLDIRIPVYKQEKGGFYGDFYIFLQDQKIELNQDVDYNKDLIKSLKSDLIYDKYYAARKFANAKI
ncbi:hypothetical protein OJ923_06330 [Streptococcus anginosus]|uniref:hypothetical protein n=1 Tax=Streptococcus anginosus TaxID=1328 RepID=UPI0021F8C722|nr:hypothetical protein [Streptococcus anginosus]MCW1036245.1 hypothetical protein [Streptococcus anginosus]